MKMVKQIRAMKKDDKALILWPLGAVYVSSFYGVCTGTITVIQFLTLAVAELTLMLAVLKEKNDDDDDERKDK